MARIKGSGMQGRTALQAHVPETLAKQVRDAAAEAGRPVSSFTRELIEEAMRRRTSAAAH